MKVPAAEVARSPQFLALVRRRWTVCLCLSAVMVGTYFGFIFLLALHKNLFGIPVGRIPIGIFAGLGLIVAAWFLTGIYIYWANYFYDGKVEQFRRSVGHEN